MDTFNTWFEFDLSREDDFEGEVDIVKDYKDIHDRLTLESESNKSYLYDGYVLHSNVHGLSTSSESIVENNNVSLTKRNLTAKSETDGIAMKQKQSYPNFQTKKVNSFWTVFNGPKKNEGSGNFQDEYVQVSHDRNNNQRNEQEKQESMPKISLVNNGKTLPHQSCFWKIGKFEGWMDDYDIISEGSDDGFVRFKKAEDIVKVLKVGTWFNGGDQDVTLEFDDISTSNMITNNENKYVNCRSLSSDSILHSDSNDDYKWDATYTSNSSSGQENLLLKIKTDASIKYNQYLPLGKENFENEATSQTHNDLPKVKSKSNYANDLETLDDAKDFPKTGPVPQAIPLTRNKSFDHIKLVMDSISAKDSHLTFNDGQNTLGSEIIHDRSTDTFNSDLRSADTKHSHKNYDDCQQPYDRDTVHNQPKDMINLELTSKDVKDSHKTCSDGSQTLPNPTKDKVYFNLTSQDVTDIRITWEDVVMGLLLGNGVEYAAVIGLTEDHVIKLANFQPSIKGVQQLTDCLERSLDIDREELFLGSTYYPEPFIPETKTKGKHIEATSRDGTTKCTVIKTKKHIIVSTYENRMDDSNKQTPAEKVQQAAEYIRQHLENSLDLSASDSIQ